MVCSSGRQGSSRRFRSTRASRAPAVRFTCSIGGAQVEGPVLQEGFESFVGQFPVPMRHGMTVGELALLFNDAFGIGGELRVMEMEGWARETYYDSTGLPWVMPSPNMPTLDTAVVYPGSVLFEGTNISEGRGTTRPFELIGAPWLDATFDGALKPDDPSRGLEPHPSRYTMRALSRS